ncbi:MAG: hypothetical protein SNJ67_12945, partial [Chloracidobacterium sp.]
MRRIHLSDLITGSFHDAFRLCSTYVTPEPDDMALRPTLLKRFFNIFSLFLMVSGPGGVVV